MDTADLPSIVPGPSYREVCAAIALEGVYQTIRRDYRVDWSRDRFFRVGERLARDLVKAGRPTVARSEFAAAVALDGFKR